MELILINLLRSKHENNNDYYFHVLAKIIRMYLIDLTAIDTLKKERFIFSYNLSNLNADKVFLHFRIFEFSTVPFPFNVFKFSMA